ncbi:hypothetical protein C8R47DRAFT_1098425 [Mycena vitilis]|nr:hypothetical protein C8R47DRAFT_1098425 [Mycena vitilis]
MANKHPHLPSFLTPLGNSANEAVFNHPNLGSAHSWWRSADPSPEAILLFIPGNPGLLNFYTEFLELLHNKHPRMAVFGHAHLSHTPNVDPGRNYSLAAQVESAIEAADAIRAEFSEAKLILSGHSVGAWVALQVLKARPSDISQLFLLCPTLTHIADTPNGRRLSWLFRTPLPRIVSWLSYLTRPLPLSILFPWSASQIAVLRSLLNSPTSIFACLSMAHEEMSTIRELDAALLQDHRHRLFFMFAAKDDWISTHKKTIMHLISSDESAMFVDEADVPHAFCLAHGLVVAGQCSLWLSSLSL